MPDIFSASETNKSSSPKVHQEPDEAKTVSGFWARKSLSSFLVRPKLVRFQTQEKDEEVVLFLRKHPVTNLGWVITVLIALALPISTFPIIFQTGLIPENLPAGYFVVLPYLWYLGVFGFGFANFLSWYFNVNIVTNERLIDIDWLGLLYRRHSSTMLERVQDVTYKQTGILDSFFDYGSVYVQTAGTEPNFEFLHIPKPNEVATQINKLLESKQLQSKSK